MSDDRMVTANITELRTDNATVANNAIELIAEGTLRPDLIDPVMRLGLPFSVGNLTRHGRMAVRDNLVSLDQGVMAARAYDAWQRLSDRWDAHISGQHTKKCNCTDPGPYQV